jgi:tetratricopeptide (TPR) repeat protein
MRPSRNTTFAASALLVVFFSASVALLQWLDKLRLAAPLDEVLYISSPKLLKRMSLGYDGLLADVYWTRAVQYFGRQHQVGNDHFALLAPLLEIATTLDPHLVVAYDFGANFLAPNPPNGAGLPGEALKLVQRGVASNPDNWKLYYQLGFINYMQFKNYSAAADAFARGSELPNAHPFMKLLAARMAQHAGDSEMARALWTTTYNSTKDTLIRANALAHLRAIQSDQAVSELQELAARFRQSTGHFPQSFEELVGTGALRGIPVDPVGHTYKLLPEGQVEVRVPDDLPFIEKGLPPGYKPPTKTKLLPTNS